MAQSAHDYLDLGHYEDLVFTLQVTNIVNGPVTMYYETSPTQEDNGFLAMLFPFTMALGVRVDKAFFATAAVPPARYARWRLVGPGTAQFGVSFRIWLAAYSFASPDSPPVQCKPACA